jgi:hypothetical protein
MVGVPDDLFKPHLVSAFELKETSLSFWIYQETLSAFTLSGSKSLFFFTQTRKVGCQKSEVSETFPPPEIVIPTIGGIFLFSRYKFEHKLLALKEGRSLLSSG